MKTPVLDILEEDSAGPGDEERLKVQYNSWKPVLLAS